MSYQNGGYNNNANATKRNFYYKENKEKEIMMNI